MKQLRNGYDSRAVTYAQWSLDEILGMKAYLAHARNVTRDYLDFAALATCTDETSVLNTLMQSDQRYGELQRDSVALEIAKALAEPQPYDLDGIDLQVYKGIRPPFDD